MTEEKIAEIAEKYKYGVPEGPVFCKKLDCVLTVAIREAVALARKEAIEQILPDFKQAMREWRLYANECTERCDSVNEIERATDMESQVYQNIQKRIEVIERALAEEVTKL